MNSFVLDASVALAWFMDPVAAALATRVQQLLLQGGRAIVPSLWRPEVANGFVMAQKRGTLSAARIAQAFSELDLLMAHSIEVSIREFSVRHLVAASQQFGLTAYDAVYLETARELRLPLATLDKSLVSVASRAGVLLVK